MRTWFTLVLLLALLSLPVPAGATNDTAASLFTGTVELGKSGSCDTNTGAGSVSGGGLGVPVITPAKTVWVAIDATTLTGGITVKACGEISADCSSGSGEVRGVVSVNGTDRRFSATFGFVGNQAALGSQDVETSKATTVGTLLMLGLFQPEWQACLSKEGPKTDGEGMTGGPWAGGLVLQA